VRGLDTYILAGSVTTCDYNYRIASVPLDATVSVRNDAVTTEEHYRYAAPYCDAGDGASPEPETESGAFYARIHYERQFKGRPAFICSATQRTSHTDR